MRLLKLNTVVVAIDLDPSSDAALDSGHRLATLAGAALHVVHVVHVVHVTDPATQAASGTADEAVRAALSRVRVREEEATVHILPGAPAEAIRSFADRLSADLVVVGAHRDRGRAANAHPLGSTARAVTEHAYAPCLVTGQPLRLPLARVLVPIDRSDTARGALLIALSWASALRTRGAAGEETTLSVLHVETALRDDATATWTTSVEEEIELVRAEAGHWAGVAIRGCTEKGGEPADVIARHAAEHDAGLVVLGTRGLGSHDADGIGSVSAAVMSRLQLPVLLVPPGVWRVHGAVR